MKKGFTMIELIFVIVILGILAAVAIPRLTATRDDAEVSKAATNLTTLISDVSSYYTSQGKFADNLQAMTNVQVTQLEDNSNALTAAGNNCLKVTLNEYNSTTQKPASLRVVADGNNTSVCDKIHAMPSIKKILDGKFVYKSKGAGGSITDANSSTGEIAISGLGVVY